MAFLFLAWADEPDITVSFSIDVCREKRTESNPVQLVKGQESTYNDLVWGLRATGNTIIHHWVFFHFIYIQYSSCVLVRNHQWFTNLENTFSQRLMANLTKSWMWPLIRIEITVPLQSQCVFMSKDDIGQPSFFWPKDKIICITFSKFKKNYCTGILDELGERHWLWNLKCRSGCSFRNRIQSRRREGWGIPEKVRRLSRTRKLENFRTWIFRLQSYFIMTKIVLSDICEMWIKYP